MTSDGGKCHNLTPPIPDLLTNSKPPKHRIKVICMGVSFLAHDLADAVMRRCRNCRCRWLRAAPPLATAPIGEEGRPFCIPTKLTVTPPPPHPPPLPPRVPH